MADSPAIATKQQYFATLLDAGVAQLRLDARVPGVVVPQHLSQDLALALNFSYRYQIDDFEFDDQRVIASLSFAGTPLRCEIPWLAVYAIADLQGRGQVWPHDVPLELQRLVTEQEPEDEPAQSAPAQAKRAKAARKPAPKTARPGLRVIDGGQAQPSGSAPQSLCETESGTTPTPQPPPPRPALRRIK